MRSPLAITQNITIPSDAIPGQARIVIGSDLPAPLDTYVPSAVVPGSTGLAGAIIWYSEGDDTTYRYDADVEDGATQVAATIQGWVVGGVLQEFSAGFPEGLTLTSDTGTGGTRARLYADNVAIFGRQTMGVSSDTTAQVFHASGSGVVSATAAGVSITAPLAGGDVAITAADMVALTAGGALSGVTADATGVAVSGPNVTLFPNGGEIQLNGNVDWGGSASKSTSAAAVATTTSTSYVQLAVCGFSFVAPPSGQIRYSWTAEMFSTVAAQYARAAAQIREGGTIGVGTIVVAVGDGVSAAVQGTSEITTGRGIQVAGLTPGDTYNIELLQRSTNGAATASFFRRYLELSPVFN